MSDAPHKRRVRYAGTHPRRFDQKYKELQPEKYSDEIAKVIARGHTPAGAHRPICVDEILDVLHPMPGETGLDATLGFGGHSLELLNRIVPGGRLFATDVDPVEMPRTTERLKEAGFGEDVFFPRHMNFAGLLKLLPESGLFDFLLADLGISSMQLDNPERGFTFKAKGPLDLRLNPERGLPVSELLKSWSQSEIEKILIRNSDEPHAAAIAAELNRLNGQINTTTDLANAVSSAIDSTVLHGDLATARTKALQRTFQAFRIEANGEFSALDQLLRALPYAVKPQGRIAILTFHSGEDNRVAAAFEQGLADGTYSAISEEPVRPTPTERYSNPRSKCARLRWAIRA